MMVHRDSYVLGREAAVITYDMNADNHTLITFRCKVQQYVTATDERLANIETARCLMHHHCSCISTTASFLTHRPYLDEPKAYAAVPA